MIDENLPPAMARAMAELFKNEHEVIHLRARFGPGVTDTKWIRTLSAEGGWTVISADRRISRNKAEQAAFRSSKLVGFFFPPSLQGASILRKMERLMVTWINIEAQVSLVQGGSMFEIPAKGNRLRPL